MRGFLARLTVGTYWLALGTWLGAMIMLALAAAATFHVSREMNVTVPLLEYAPSHLAGRDAEVLGGNIVGRMIDHLSVLQMVCAVLIFITLLFQLTVFRATLHLRAGSAGNVLRVLLLVAALGLLKADRIYINPAVHEHRTRLYEPDLTDAEYADAREAFDTYHHLSENVGKATVFVLIGAMLTSAFALHPRRDDSKSDADDGEEESND